MIDWILRELEKQPVTEFYQKDLEDRDSVTFTRLKLEKLLVYVQPDVHSESYGFDQREPLTVVKINGQLYGINEKDPEADLVPLSRTDLMRYRFSLESFVQKLAEANDFSGFPKKLFPRLYYAGERKIDGNRVALVLAFIDQEKSAENLLLSLPGRLTSGFKQFYVVTPSYTVQSLELREQLERQRILVIPLQDFEAFKIDLSPLAREGTDILTPQQEDECRLYGFIYRVRIHITGERGGKASNFILVGDTRVSIGDSPFAIFLRLVLGLHNEKTGEVPKSYLSAEGYFKKDEDEYQKIGRLRQCFANIPNINRLEFIKDQNKSLKLAVHPSFITWDIDRLLTHRDTDILKLVNQLPKSP